MQSRRARLITLVIIWAIAIIFVAMNLGYIAPIGWAAVAALLAASTWFLAVRR